METSTHEETGQVDSEGVDAADEAVRAYLSYLQDRKSIVDQDEIANLTEELDNETDPLEQLRLASAIAGLRSADDTKVRAGFIEHAKPWAEQNLTAGYVEAFKTLNVAPKVLREAGFSVRGGGKRKHDRQVGSQAVVDAIPEDPFTITEIVTATQASGATVRNVVLQMVQDGEVIDLGQDPNHTGRGRTPKLYQRA